MLKGSLNLPTRRRFASAWDTNREGPDLNRAIAFPIATCLLASAGPGLAQPQPENGAVAGSLAARKSILITWVGDEAPLGLGERIASWFVPRPSIRLEPASSLSIPLTDALSNETSSHVWVDLRGSPKVRIYLEYSVARQAPRYLVHELVLEAGLSEVGLEHLAQAIYSSLSALHQDLAQSSWTDLERSIGNPTWRLDTAHQSPNIRPHASASGDGPNDVAQAGQSRPTSTMRPDTQASPVGTPWSWHLTLGTGYGANLRGAEGLAWGPTLWATAGRKRRNLALGGYATGRYCLPVEPEAANVIVRLNGFKLRFGGTLEFTISQQTSLSIGVGFGFDELQVRPRTSDSTKRALPGGWEERTVGNAFVGIALPTLIGPMFLVGELDVPLQRSHYDLHLISGRSQELFDSPAFHPGLAILMRFDPLHRDP